MSVRFPLALLLAGSLATVAACTGDNATADGDVSLTSDEDRALYSLGQILGRQLAELELSDSEMEYVLAGARDQVRGAEPQVDADTQQQLISAFVQERQAATSAENADQHAEQQAYIEAYIADGGEVTDSGLAYRILEEGEGDKPGSRDTVEVHYEGRLTNGDVFDSSHQRGETATFPLNRVIAGWTEGLQLIAPGGRIELVIPAELGYGERGSPPTIPGGATLIFEVELIDVK
ncbi:FKBP-type peptidyl-prolyl cis-trans isomerase [Methylonatrum kenyense]|uniref:FKBP-type peptidyl-prolyl cis-trans isomerase n=1 Tax=Methylonatrum kenyense TaxID=455253 RepID=UPI0020BEACFE|nr:FKBP-type peptidyl-prolyl cis-trans isomerase [Methylonatrum kenyense]MCK8515881.1 FKBP-type peptidyl-prolyl cis-trans isomerase [Methylonatrum kenyense]